ncbi:cytochrome o ubiquinol oxidase subunit III [Candidatus Aerophobetes bacterium]|uniref:Cytochrome o ubiquinol oxidase subunit III n=1 Tax=Aerophobetes bacterium TaxID=2030807 RepID=A0A2A4X4C8_UNCAE|nr:MAG: cytochrome o ubiquinol oxidase subunit III [Candidatus Aerophobetes bacterium]
MSNSGSHVEVYPDTHHDVYSKTVFGFWLYLITDFVLFATMFAAFAVLSKSFFGAAEPKQMFNLSYTALQSFLLLGASFTAGLGGAMVHRRKMVPTLVFFILTFCLGSVFAVSQFKELSNLVSEGINWTQSAYLSMFFSIIMTFLIHVVIALLWTVVLIVPTLFTGLDSVAMRRLTCLRMFWQFLNIVWVFIFTIVYLAGVI